MVEPYPYAGHAHDDLRDILNRARLRHDDLGNMRRLKAVHGQDMLHADGIGWAVWDGRRFDTRRGGAMAQQRATTLQAILGEEYQAVTASAIPIKQIERWRAAHPGKSAEDAQTAIRQEQTKTWQAAIKRAGNRTAIENAGKLLIPYSKVDSETFDAQLQRLTLGNGTLQLGAEPAFFDRFDHEDRATRIAGANYNPKASCPKFLEFLEWIQPDPDMQTYLQQVFGYCLTGRQTEQCVFLFKGEGRNGKSMLLSVIRNVLGEYVATAPIESFLREKIRSSSGPSPDIARLAGARMVLASEPNSNAVLDEGRIKGWSGGESIMARKLKEDFIDFIPTGKLFLSFNRTPRIYSDDDGTWRRLHVVPFAVQIPKELRRPFEVVLAELTTEASGIINWMIAGWLRYHQTGALNPPEIVSAASTELRESFDTIGQFLVECTIKGERELCLFSELYTIYERWCNRVGDRPVSRKAMARALDGKGYANQRGGAKKVAMRAGLRMRLRNEAHADIGAEWAAWLDDTGIYPQASQDPSDDPPFSAGDF